MASLLGRKTSRELNVAFEADNEMFVSKFPSGARWRSKPQERGHIEEMACGNGTETTSPVEGEKNYFLVKHKQSSMIQINNEG